MFYQKLYSIFGVIKWTQTHGAAFVVDHHHDLVTQVRELSYKYVDYILELKDLDDHGEEMCELVKPNGDIVSITENKHPINLRKAHKMVEEGHMIEKVVISGWEE